MARAIIKIKDKYFAWSSICDAPVSAGLSLAELQGFIADESGEYGLNWLERVLPRVETDGVSVSGYSLKDFLACNRAGPDETYLTPDEIYAQYSEDQKE